MLAVVLFILLVYAYSLLSRRLAGSVLTIPLVFAVAGIVLALVAPGLVKREVEGLVWPRPTRSPVHLRSHPVLTDTVQPGSR